MSDSTRSPVVVTDLATLERMIDAAVRRALREVVPAPEPVADWLDAEGAAALLGVCSRTLKKRAGEGEIPSSRVGRLWRFSRADLVAYLKRDAA